MRLYVGGNCGTVQGEKEDLGGYRCFSAARKPDRGRIVARDVIGLLDSGAFTDPPEKRLTPDTALNRQLAWERRASDLWGARWQAQAIVSYDLLIDETWVGGVRHKRRWDVRQADDAVRVTVEAAEYLVSQRERLEPRTLVLSCQGVDPIQYAECAADVLRLAQPHDWIGLGGWCILGRQRSLLPSFWATLRLVLPMIRGAGVGHVHIFGVMWEKALGGLVYLADQHGIAVSADSTSPITSCTRPDPRRAGVRAHYWRDNVRWWQDRLAGLRRTEWYREPPDLAPARQLDLFGEAS